MFDGTHASLEAVLDGPWTIGVRQHVGADRAGRLDRGAQLGNRELDVVELVGG